MVTVTKIGPYFYYATNGYRGWTRRSFQTRYVYKIKEIFGGINHGGVQPFNQILNDNLALQQPILVIRNKNFLELYDKHSKICPDHIIKDKLFSVLDLQPYGD